MGGRPEVLAFIPARGGSKSVPRKNLVEVGGRPLIAHSILHAEAARRITRTIVSTEDEEIAGVAEEWGADVPFVRPDKLAGDASPDIDVLRHVLEWLRDEEGYSPELVVHLRPTNPVRRSERIDAAIEQMLATPEADALRSVQIAEQTPYKMWRIEDQCLVAVAELDGLCEAHSMPRQILPRTYWQNGYVDIVRPRTVLEKCSMVGDLLLPFVIKEESCDIDYPEDVERADDTLRRLARGGAQRAPRGDRSPS